MFFVVFYFFVLLQKENSDLLKAANEKTVADFQHQQQQQSAAAAANMSLVGPGAQNYNFTASTPISQQYGVGGGINPSMFNLYYPFSYGQMYSNQQPTTQQLFQNVDTFQHYTPPIPPVDQSVSSKLFET